MPGLHETDHLGYSEDQFHPRSLFDLNFVSKVRTFKRPRSNNFNVLDCNLVLTLNTLWNPRNLQLVIDIINNTYQNYHIEFIDQELTEDQVKNEVLTIRFVLYKQE